MDFAHRLKEMRKNKGYTQLKLAQESGISYGSIVNYENGRRTEIQASILFRIAKALGVSAFDLVPQLREKLHDQALEAIHDLDESYKQWIIDRFDCNDRDAIALVGSYFELNETGRKEAVKRIQELLCIPMYSNPQEVTPCPEDAPQTVAEHSPVSDPTDAGK